MFLKFLQVFSFTYRFMENEYKIYTAFLSIFNIQCAANKSLKEFCKILIVGSYNRFSIPTSICLIFFVIVKKFFMLQIILA